MHANIKLNSTKKTYAKILLLASIGLVLAFIGGLSVSADTYKSDNFKVLDPVISAGAKRVTSDNYILSQSVGKSGLGKSMISDFELSLGFLTRPIRPVSSSADLNSDGLVNLVDFSIIWYNWGTPKSDKADLNSDGLVNLVDFSIIMYQWRV